MTPPDVLYRHRGDLYDDTATSWDARNLQPLTPEPSAEEPPKHKADCYFTPWPNLAGLCGCSTNADYLRAAHPH